MGFFRGMQDPAVVDQAAHHELTVWVPRIIWTRRARAFATACVHAASQGSATHAEERERLVGRPRTARNTAAWCAGYARFADRADLRNGSSTRTATEWVVLVRGKKNDIKGGVQLLPQQDAAPPRGVLVRQLPRGNPEYLLKFPAPDTLAGQAATKSSLVDATPGWPASAAAARGCSSAHLRSRAGLRQDGPPRPRCWWRGWLRARRPHRRDSLNRRDGWRRPGVAWRSRLVAEVVGPTRTAWLRGRPRRHAVVQYGRPIFFASRERTHSSVRGTHVTRTTSGLPDFAGRPPPPTGKGKARRLFPHGNFRFSPAGVVPGPTPCRPLQHPPHARPASKIQKYRIPSRNAPLARTGYPEPYSRNNRCPSRSRAGVGTTPCETACKRGQSHDDDRQSAGWKTVHRGDFGLKLADKNGQAGAAPR